MRVRPSNVVIAGFVLLMGFSQGCDQPAGPDRAEPPTPAATSSEKKQTHPEQPTGKPQSSDSPQPGGSK